MSDNQDWRTDRDRSRDERSRDERPRDSLGESPREAPLGDSRSDDRPGRSRERMSTQYDDDLPPPRRRVASGGLSAVLGSDELTRRLVYGALGIGAVLVLAVGGGALLGGHQRGIPVFGPPPGPVRDQPTDPGGMQIMGGDGADTDTTGQGEARLAPGPEQPRPDALAQQYGQPGPAAAPEKAAAPIPATPRPEPSPASGGGPQQVSPVVPSKETEAPSAVVQDTKPAVSASAPKSSVATATTQTPAASASDRFLVQLAALDNEAEAHREWDILSHQAPDLFSGRTPIVERTDREKRSYYRLRLGGFDSVQAARAFCIKAHARTIACTPAQF